VDTSKGPFIINPQDGDEGRWEVEHRLELLGGDIRFPSSSSSSSNSSSSRRRRRRRRRRREEG